MIVWSWKQDTLAVFISHWIQHHIGEHEGETQGSALKEQKKKA